MNHLNLHISPVYSLYHPGASINGMRLLQHQVETQAAFDDPDSDVIINIAMTGDGKSISGYLPTFSSPVADKHVIAMYPTNELIKDQYAAIKRYEEKLKLKLPRYETMYSDQITRLMREHDENRRSEEVRKLLTRHGILLTNPDLVHLIRSYQYGRGFQRRELSQVLASNFDYMLFDEFHVFGTTQVVSVVNMLAALAVHYSDKPQERKKFVFLSATPNSFLTRLLEHSGLRYKIISGHYSDSAHDDYRCILQRCEISLHALRQEQSSEVWIEEHLETLLRFFQDYPESKAAILVYSPATARRLVRRLKAFFDPHGISVGENTGLTTADDRREALQKQILVGTSTVDVGIDFHINYLIFEGFNAGSFLQRFGRLGRHDEFKAYRAYALIPGFVLERITSDLGNEHKVSRERFNQAIREAFPLEQEFAAYKQIWGPIQAAHVLEDLKTQQGKDNLDENRAFRQVLTERYDNMYRSPAKPDLSAMERAGKTHWKLKRNSPEIIKELLSFRGQSVLDCGVWDLTDPQKHPNGTLITYDLFFLLTNTDFEVIEDADFLSEVQSRGLEERDFRHKLLYLKVHNYIRERSSLRLGINKSLLSVDANNQYLHRLLVLSGLVVQEPQNVWNDRVNRELRRQKLPCIISPSKPQELRWKHKLSGLFPLYRLRDQTGSEYAVVLGQEALLLDSLLRFRPAAGGSCMMA